MRNFPGSTFGAFDAWLFCLTAPSPTAGIGRSLGLEVGMGADLGEGVGADLDDDDDDVVIS